jgi:hypothetical protein
MCSGYILSDELGTDLHSGQREVSEGGIQVRCVGMFSLVFNKSVKKRVDNHA